MRESSTAAHEFDRNAREFGRRRGIRSGPPSVYFVAEVLGYLLEFDAHGTQWRRLESDDPGRVVYEDADQVIVVPYA